MSWWSRSFRGPQTILFITVPFDCPPKLGEKTLLLKTPHTTHICIARYREIKQAPSWNLLLNGFLMVLKEAIQGACEKNVGGVTHRWILQTSLETHQARWVHLYDSGRTIMAVTKYSNWIRGPLYRRKLMASMGSKCKNHMAGKIIGPRGELHAILLSWHSIKLSSKYLFISRDWWSSQS